MNKTKKIGVILTGVVIILSLALLLWRSAEGPFSATKGAVGQTENFAQARRLEGQWVRPDGGYRLVIEDVKPDGSLKASYFNPSKINVSISNWKVEDDRLGLFIELRDTNYPGSKYTLVHAKEKDVLEGTYFLAVTKETYSVKFLKIPQAQN